MTILLYYFINILLYYDDVANRGACRSTLLLLYCMYIDSNIFLFFYCATPCGAHRSTLLLYYYTYVDRLNYISIIIWCHYPRRSQVYSINILLYVN